MQPDHTATLVRCHVNGLIPFKGTIKQTTENNAPSSKTISADTTITAYESCYTSDATPLKRTKFYQPCPERVN